MTAVVDRKTSGTNLPAVTDASAPASGSPSHCGAAMTMAAAESASLPWAPLQSGFAAWTCGCGYRLDADIAAEPLAAVRLASARVESLHWELDAAQERFENALKAASGLGADRSALALAAGLTPDELQDLLQ
ncbi:hypothetical protein ABLI39_10345 [Pseudarthrobacter sp. B907]|uniref:hypothetical protein n=1 Tax=Pseudarthrobacter sp. B907 TaxID=3158261 RepID=UPI0032DB7A38